MRVRRQFQKIRCTIWHVHVKSAITKWTTNTLKSKVQNILANRQILKCNFWRWPLLPELLVVHCTLYIVQADTLTGNRSNHPSWAASYKYSAVATSGARPGDLNRATTILLTIIWEGQKKKKKNGVRIWEKDIGCGNEILVRWKPRRNIFLYVLGEKPG